VSRGPSSPDRGDAGSPLAAGGSRRAPEDRVSTASYEIRIRGHASDALSVELPSFTVRATSAETVLYGRAVDQSALHGALDRLEELGLELLEVRRLPSGH
jgi:hypothetical protein